MDGVFIGYGIEVTYDELAEAFGIELGEGIYDHFGTLENYFHENQIGDVRLSVLEKSHKAGDSERKLYFGHFVKIAGYDCWGSRVISSEMQTELQSILNSSPFKEICVERFKVEAQLMTVVLGCPCCH